MDIANIVNMVPILSAFGVGLVGLLIFFASTRSGNKYFSFLGGWQKKRDMLRVLGVGIVVLAVIGGALDQGNYNILKEDVSIGAQQQETEVTQEVPSSCPADGDTSLKINVYNPLNTSGVENYDVTIHLIDEETGKSISTITDTTSPSATTINCGTPIILKVVASDGSGGSNSRFTGIGVADGADATLLPDGSIRLVPTSGNVNLKLDVPQHGTLYFRVYDNMNAQFAYDTGDSTNTDWELTGTTFTSGDNTTPFTIGSDGELDLSIQMKAVENDADPNDLYMLCAVEAPVTEWDEPTVKYNGALLSDVSGALNPDEEKDLAGYEYVYKIEGSIDDTSRDLDLDIHACAGCNPSTDVEVDCYVAGNYLATDSSQTIKSGTAKDDSSKTDVFTKQEITIDIA